MNFYLAPPHEIVSVLFGMVFIFVLLLIGILHGGERIKKLCKMLMIAFAFFLAVL